METSCGVIYGTLWETQTHLRSEFVDFLNQNVCWEQIFLAETYVVSKFLSQNVCYVKILEPKRMLFHYSCAKMYVKAGILN